MSPSDSHLSAGAPTCAALLCFLSYLAAGVSFLLLGWDRCQRHPRDPSSPGVGLSFSSISRLCWGCLLQRCLRALSCSGVQVLLAQAVVATGGVKDVGLEPGARWLLTSRRHAGIPSIICDRATLFQWQITMNHLISNSLT